MSVLVLFLSVLIVICIGETKPLWLGRLKGSPVEQALVDDRSPNGLPKKPSCAETESSTIK